MRALAQQGYRIRVAVRRPDLAVHLQPLGGVGQIHAVQANLRYPASIKTALEGVDAAINLVGIAHETGWQDFEGVHVFGAQAVAKAVAEMEISRFVHMSALSADETSGSEFARTKAEGDKCVREAFAGATILQPSVVFGPEDRFFNKYAGLLRLCPIFPLPGGGETKLQPVFVGDVALAVAACLKDDGTSGKAYELGGAEVLSFKQCLEFICKTTGRNRLLVPTPFGIVRFKSQFLKFFPNPIITPDQVDLLKHDSIVSEQAIVQNRTLEGLGVAAHLVEAIVPTYLARFRRAGQFTRIDASTETTD